MQSDWVLYSKACPGRAEQVVDYLSRYSHRIAISDERILKADESQVSFRVKDYANEGTRSILTLDTEEFIRRYFFHVLPKGLMRVCHYGFLANRCRRRCLREIRTALGAITSSENQSASDASTSVSVYPDSDKQSERACPACKQGHLHARYRIEAYRMTEN